MNIISSTGVMSGSTSNDRQRTPSNGYPTSRTASGTGVSVGGVRSHPDPRLPASTTSGHGSTMSSRSHMTRAEKFEDEKKRIIESCFSKKEPDGSIAESYITHIRIDEDAEFPSVPPPLESPPENKKPRVIMIAVKKSGRVRLHKGRENANGSFSIGKTWALDDLTKIESFIHASPRTAEERQLQQRAGPTGFIITIGKPYYWRAATPKEKDFFIFSLIKIYRKYTAGKLPDLVGFSIHEVDLFTGSSSQLQSNGDRRSASQQQQLNTGANGLPLQSRQVSLSTTSRDNQSLFPPELRSTSQPIPTPPPPKASSRFPSNDTQRTISQINISPQIRQPEEAEDDVAAGNSRQVSDYQTRSPATTADLRPLKTRTSGADSSFPKPTPLTRDNLRSVQQDNRYGKSGPISSETLSHRLQALANPQVSRNASTAVDERKLNIPVNSDSILADLAERSSSRPPTHDSSTSSGAKRFQFPLSTVSTTPPATTTVEKSFDPSVAEAWPPVRAKSVDPKPIDQQRNDTVDARFRGPEDNSQQEPQLPSQECLPRSDQSKPGRLATDVSAQAPESLSLEPPPEPQETFRPGLGPMIKKKSQKDVASQFRKAATAYSAFQPRSATSTTKVVQVSESGGDGVTGVFQAPSLHRQESSQVSKSAVDATAASTTKILKQDGPKSGDATISSTSIPKDNMTSLKLAYDDDQLLVKEPQPGQKLSETEASIAPAPPVPPLNERRKKRRSDHGNRYAMALGINPAMLVGRCAEAESLLNDFGWDEAERSNVTYDDLVFGVRKELARVEAGTWLGTVESNDQRASAVKELLDRVVAECDELDCLLTLYNVELGTLHEDVAYIEAQSQGLQVQAANQKLLHAELSSLLSTIAIPSSHLQSLREASLSKPAGIQAAEATLSQLYSALLTIDPTLHSEKGMSNRQNSHIHVNNELSAMRAVQEKKLGYQKESSNFAQRLEQSIAGKLREFEADTNIALQSSNSIRYPALDTTDLKNEARNGPRLKLFLYSPLLLYVREVEPSSWIAILRMYENTARKLFAEELQANVAAWKRVTRCPTGDEPETLFTVQDKEANDGLVGRKLTVKRSKTFRNNSSSRLSEGLKTSADGRLTAYQAFSGALAAQARHISVEQNFIVDLFHASSLDEQDFADAISVNPTFRHLNDLLLKKPLDPDRERARRLTAVVENIFAIWPGEIQSVAEWVTKQDPLNIVGLLCALESQIVEYEETNQEFLTQTFSKIHDRLSNQYDRFIEEQIRAVEDTKVKIKKRKGVIAFIKTFPVFCSAIEVMLGTLKGTQHLPVRKLVDDAYASINKAMFECLKYLAREEPSIALGTSSVGHDHEDKEALNHHILIIENMHHYLEGVTPRENVVLREWHSRARTDMHQHLDLYLTAVIRRPLGKLLDFLESTETLVAQLQQGHAGPRSPDLSDGSNNQPNSIEPLSPTTIASRPSHSRAILKKVLAAYDVKELRRGIETLRRRVEKHFGDTDEARDTSSGDLYQQVIKSCEEKYRSVRERLRAILRDVYEDQIELEWRMEDLSPASKR